MFGLPQLTDFRQQLEKSTVYSRLNLSTEQRNLLDAEISSLDIVSRILPNTVPAIAEGDYVKGISVIVVKILRKDYNPKAIERLAVLIQQKIVFALQYEDQTQFAVYYTKLITSEWMPTEAATLPLSGLNLDSVWENFVRSIGHIEPEAGKTLAEQIEANSRRQKLLTQISALERKLANEKQPHKKREIFTQIKTLKGTLDS